MKSARNPEIKKLSGYFSKIEKIVKEMGIDMDDLMNEFKNNNTATYHTFKDKLFTKAGQRASTYKKAKNDPTDEVWVEKC